MRVNRLEDVRILVWMKDKLVWLSREEPDWNLFPAQVAYRFDTKNPFFLIPNIVWLPIVPVSVNVSLKTTGSNNASITFASTRDFLLTREKPSGLDRRYLGLIRTEDEQKNFFSKSPAFLRTILNSRDASPDELLVAFLRNYHAYLSRPQLIAIGKELSYLLGDDHRRLESILSRLSD